MTHFFILLILLLTNYAAVSTATIRIIQDNYANRTIPLLIQNEIFNENIIIQYSHSLYFHNTIFKGSVIIQHSQHINVTSSFFYQGITIVSSSHILVYQNNITNNNGTCVYIPSCGNSTNFQYCNITIENNYIHDCHIPFNGTSPYAPVAQGILLGGNEGSDQVTVGVMVKNNLVENIDQMGIRINNDNYGASILNTITLNRIINWGMLPASEGGDNRDCGCIYLYGHWFGPGNQILYNDCLVTNTSWGQNGVYLDDASTGQIIIGNYFRNQTYGSPIKLNGGSFNYIDSNIVINGINLGFGNCRGLRGTEAMWYTCVNEGRWLEILENNNYLTGLWGDHFPWYQGWCTNTTAGPNNYLCAPPSAPSGYTCEVLSRGNEIQNMVGIFMTYNNSFVMQNTESNNTYSNGTGICPQYVVTENFNSIDWNTVNKFYIHDQFVNSSYGDYTLRSDAQIYIDMPNFVRIPYMAIGPLVPPPEMILRMENGE